MKYTAVTDMDHSIISLLSPADKDASESGDETTECFAYTQAAQLLDSVVTSIMSEEVNVECVETITRHRQNFEELVTCYYGQPNAKAVVDCNYILQRTQKLASDIAQFEELRRNLLFLCRGCLTVFPARCEGKG